MGCTAAALLWPYYHWVMVHTAVGGRGYHTVRYTVVYSVLVRAGEACIDERSVVKVDEGGRVERIMD